MPEPHHHRLITWQGFEVGFYPGQLPRRHHRIGLAIEPFEHAAALNAGLRRIIGVGQVFKFAIFVVGLLLHPGKRLALGVSA